jgi:hypothetical protein
MIVEVAIICAGGAIRLVNVPDDEWAGGMTDDRLSMIFAYGQNMHQARPIPSVSVGDIIFLPKEPVAFVVKGTGFEPISTRKALSRTIQAFDTEDGAMYRIEHRWTGKDRDDHWDKLGDMSGESARWAGVPATQRGSSDAQDAYQEDIDAVSSGDQVAQEL